MDQKNQIADRLKQANNILVTVSNSPSVDQLASCIGLTLALNKMGKHATAVFSGVVPSTLEFLQPEKTIEKNTDSLRDFIISLDKAKADKLRYKVEDTVVKIFITPYRTSITDKDLEFSQGDFNVDVVLALGVHNQADLDQAITSHGRILHDATVATLNVQPGGELGSINWLVPGASSLSELAFDLIETIDKQLIDDQTATALLTGIVAETARFSNERTTPDTMSISAELMAAGANQQLVATKLEVASASAPAAAQQPVALSGPTIPPSTTDPVPEEPAKSVDGTLEIAHNDQPTLAVSSGEPQDDKDATPQIRIDEKGDLHNIEEMGPKESTTDPTQHLGSSRMILQPPSHAPSVMSAAGLPDDGYSSGDPLSLPPPTEGSLGGPSVASATIAAPTMPYLPPSMTPGGMTPAPTGTDFVAPSMAPAMSSNAQSMPLEAVPAGTIERAPATLPLPEPVAPVPVASAVGVPESSVVSAPEEGATHVDDARNAVMQAIAGQAPNAVRPDPIQALNAQPLGDPLREPVPVQAGTVPDLNIPVPAVPQTVQPSAPAVSPIAPPPVPPPMMPPISQ
jgi:hypothetical protein